MSGCYNIGVGRRVEPVRGFVRWKKRRRRRRTTTTTTIMKLGASRGAMGNSCSVYREAEGGVFIMGVGRLKRDVDIIMYLYRKLEK